MLPLPPPPLQPQSGTSTPHPYRPASSRHSPSTNHCHFPKHPTNPFIFLLCRFFPLLSSLPLPLSPLLHPSPYPSCLFFTLLFAPSLSPLVIYGRVVASLPLISNLAASFVIWLQNKLHSSQVLEISQRFISGSSVF